MSRSDKLPLELRRVLVHPAWLAGLALLVTNDHALKGSGVLPGWLTGKLSDVAGLFVAPLLLALLLRARTRTRLLLVHAAVGFGFAALELSPELTGAAEALYAALGVAWRQWSDPTDLLALAVLPAAYAFALRVSSGDARAPAPGAIQTRALAATGLLACAASTSTTNVGPEDAPGAPDCSEIGAASPPCESPISEDACDNGWDDDEDGQPDCEDDDCAAACDALLEACSEAEQTAIDVSIAPILTGTTLGKPSLTESDCMGADAPEDLIRIRVPTPGTLVLGLPESHGLSVRSVCSDWRTETVCLDAGPTVEISFTESGDYTLVIEALDPLLAAPFSIPIELRSPRLP